LSGIDPDLRALAALLNNCQVVLNNLWGETVKAPSSLPKREAVSKVFLNHLQFIRAYSL